LKGTSKQQCNGGANPLIRRSFFTGNPAYKGNLGRKGMGLGRLIVDISKRRDLRGRGGITGWAVLDGRDALLERGRRLGLDRSQKTERAGLNGGRFIWRSSLSCGLRTRKQKSRRRISRQLSRNGKIAEQGCSKKRMRKKKEIRK